MKKTLVITFLFLLLTSCSGQDDNSENFEALTEEPIPEMSSEELIFDESSEQTDEQKTEIPAETLDTPPVQAPVSNETSSDTTQGDISVETQIQGDVQDEEEMMDDFNAELEDIFKLIESDNAQ